MGVIQGSYARVDSDGDAVPIDGATVTLYYDNATFQGGGTHGVSTYPPVQGTAKPAGNNARVTAPITTGSAYGAVGAYRFTALTTSVYYACIEYSTDDPIWEAHNVINITSGNDVQVGYVDALESIDCDGEITSHVYIEAPYYVAGFADSSSGYYSIISDQYGAANIVYESNSEANPLIITIPYPATNASFVLTEGTATINGTKNFAGTFQLGGVALAASAAEINKACDVSARVQSITGTGAQTVTAGVQSVELNNTTQITATIASAVNHPGIFIAKAIVEPGSTHTITLTAGTWDGTNDVATFTDINDTLVVYFDSAGNGTVVENVGTVGLT